jgi:hypothetical protein
LKHGLDGFESGFESFGECDMLVWDNFFIFFGFSSFFSTPEEDFNRIRRQRFAKLYNSSPESASISSLESLILIGQFFQIL